MKVTLESTSKVIDFHMRDGTRVSARIWEGETENGIPCHAYITLIAVSKDADASEFEKYLKQHKAPSAEIQAIHLRMVI